MKRWMERFLFRRRLTPSLLLIAMLVLMFLPNAAIAAQQAAPPQHGSYYTVSYGDSLYGIANYFGVSAQAIMDANGISDPNFVYVGQTLLIPNGAPAPAPRPSGNCSAWHYVQAGQTLSWIAAYYGVNQYTLAQANGIYNFDHIYSGLSLCIPGVYNPPAPPHPVYNPEPQPPVNVNPCNYIVRKGDTLALLARWFNTSVPELMRLNNFYNPNVLEVGWRLVLPGCTYQPPPPPYNPPPSQCCNPQPPFCCNQPYPTPTPYIPPPTPTPYIPPPTATPQAPPANYGYWSSSYYNNGTLSGSPLYTTQCAALNFDWGYGGPGGGVANDTFSATFLRSEYLYAGTYRFYVTVDDGIRLYIDDQLVINSWQVQSVSNYFIDVPLGTGYHSLRVDYFEAGGLARLAVNWAKIQ